MHELIAGLSSLMTVYGLLMLLLGTLLGTVVGAVPGLGGAVLLTMLLPFIYGMPVIPALTLLLAAHTGIYFSGSITAILFNTPGAPESAATTFDGYPMTQRGEAARALGISATSTTLGGWIGVICLFAIIPAMNQLIKLFEPSEYLFLAMLAIVLIGQMRAASVTKGLLSGCLGLMISFVGYDPITGVQRFSFGILQLYNGFNITAVALGIFALTEMYHLYAGNRSVAGEATSTAASTDRRGVMQGVRDVASHKLLVLRSGILGTVLGVIPGIGGLAANFISYGQAVRTSKHPEEFGTGTPEGVIAPEASSISKEAGNLVPTVALGVPGGVGMAVLMGGFTIEGIAPGPEMLSKHMDAVWAMALVIAIGSLLASLTGLTIAPALARLSRVPGRVLVPFIFAIAMLGAYAATQSMLQVGAVVGFGLVGLVMRAYGYSVPAAIIGFILGPIVEHNLYLTQQLQGWTSALQRPLTDILILITLALIVVPYLKPHRRNRRQEIPEQVLRHEPPAVRQVSER